MLAYFVLFLLLFINFLLTTVLKEKKTTFIITVLMTLFIILLQSLRTFEVGRDLSTYLNQYERVGSWSFIELFGNGYNEFLYFFVNKVFYVLKLNFRSVLIFTSVITYFSLKNIAINYSKTPILSIFIFIVLGFFVFSLSGLRQSIAIGISLFSFNYVVKRDFLKFLSLTICAFLFHKSAIFTVPIYFLFNIKIRDKFQFIYVIIFIITYIYKRELTIFITNLYDPGHTIVETGAITMLLLLVGFYVISGIVYNYTKKEFIYRLQRILFVAILIQTMSAYSQTISRLGYYYYVYLILLIPELFAQIKEKEYRLVLQLLFMAFFTINFMNNIKTNPLDTYPYEIIPFFF